MSSDNKKTKIEKEQRQEQEKKIIEQERINLSIEKRKSTEDVKNYGRPTEDRPKK